MKTKWKFLRRIAMATVGVGAMFQVSSCSVDDGGVLSAFADSAGLQDLRTQLLANSPLGAIFGAGNESVGDDDAVE